MPRTPTRLNPKKRYLQIALNSTLEEAQKIIAALPISDRILLEVGTPLIKRYGEAGIRQVYAWYAARLSGQPLASLLSPTAPTLPSSPLVGLLERLGEYATQTRRPPFPASPIAPYVVADLKTMDRGDTEVEIAARGGASAAIALGNAPPETLNAFIDACIAHGLDAMVDMMNVAFPLTVLRQLKRVPPVVILHRGVDEEHFNKEKQIPLHEIRRIKGNYDIMISIAGGDTVREIQRSIFNDADIVVIWKTVYMRTADTLSVVEGFLKEIK